MPRLIHLANYPNMHPGSYIPWLLAVLEEAQERGWSVEVGFPEFVRDAEWINDFTERDIPVHLIPEGGRAAHTHDVSEILGMDSSPTLIHTHFTSFDIPAALAARRHGRCVVYWHIHTVLGEGAVTVARHSAKFAIFRRRVDRILVPAANIGEGLARRMAPADKIMLMPSAIDAGAFLPASEENRQSARREWDIPDGSPVLLHIGRAWQLKGGPSFFAATKLLRDEGLPVIGLTLRGGDEAAASRDELGLGEGVRIAERVDEIRSLYALADCFVAPSEGEGMPFSIVEALACGVPVVASDLPGHRFLGDQLNACLIASRDPKEMAKAIRTMLERPREAAARDAVEARQWIVENLSLESASTRLLDAYTDSFDRAGLELA